MFLVTYFFFLFVVCARIYTHSAVKIKPMPLPKLLPDEFNGTKKLSVNTNALRNVLDISSQAHTKDDWIEWMRQYSLVLLQCSPSPQLRICYELAQEYHPLVQDLFPAAFIACWVELPDRDYLLSTLARIIESPDVPQEVTQALLDVLEFLERKERPFFAEPSPLPSSPPPQPFLRSLSPSVSGMASPIVVPSSSPSAHSPKARHQQQRAQDLTGLDGYCWPFGDPRSQMPFEKLYAASYKCRAFAKALRLKEIIYQEDPENRRHIEDLISTNNKLQLYDASRGVVVQAQKALHLELTATVYEKLREWKTALTLYEERLRNSSRSTSNSSSSNRDDLEVQLGCMRCLRALGDNKKVVEIASAALQRPGLAKQQRREIAEIGGRAGMMAESWDFVERCLRYTPEGSVTRMLFRSVLEIHAKRYDAARTYILRTREALDTEVSALLGESYERAYPAVVCAQQLSEMEQAIDYLETEDARKREIIRLSFNDKLRNTVVYEVDTWQSVLNVHALCVDRHTYPEMWVKFAGICRKQSRPALAVLVLEDLSGLPFAEIPANIARISPTISLAAAKVMWYQDKRQAEAVRFTESLCKHLVSARKGADPRITAKAFLYLGIWRYEMAKAGGTAAICDNICDISEALDTAVHYQGDWHRALHTWALFNCDLVAMCQAKEEAEERGFRMCGSCAMPISSACTSASSSYSSTPFRKLQAQRLVSPSYGGDHGYGGDGMGAGAVGSSGGVYDYYDDYGGSNSYVGDESNNNNYDYDYECEGSWNRQQGPTPWDVSEGDTDECEEGGADEGPISRKMLEKYLVVALESLVESIKLAGESTLQDMLRLVSLGFSHGHRQCAQQILTNAVRALDGSLWVQVIPQLISQMHTPTAGVQRFIAEVIGVLCEQHPQVIVYPLIVAAKSRHSARQAETARRLYEGLRVASPRVASQAEVFAKELARLSLNWYEIWFVGLDNAYRQYVEGDVRGMQKTFASLFRMYRRKAETPLEQGFVQRLDGKIYELECALQETGSGSGSNSGSSSNGGGGADIVGCMRDIYNEIERYGMGVQNASLRQCAPLLLQEDFSSLCIPGTYVPHEEPIMITAISRSVPILSSKQRPRKLQLTGSNGVRYQFLLKAREDLRQDERAMQFFGLVNTLLAAAPGTRKDHLGIVRYAVVPLSPSVGIIGWVLHSSTIYDLVQEYRRVKDIPFNMEYDLLAEFVPEYDMLTGLQKVEVMERVMEDTTGNDLKHIMWLHSANSEEWLQRRTRYARSLAVTSMSGHILGLGDRHPSNIMIDKDTGDVIHIDLGDCFEVAMHRKAYPERIPFRLTRMFINALEASGVEGSFRLTCEKVLSVLRDNKESLLTVLETFVYDPLLNWRITKAKKFEQSRAAYRPPCDCPHTDSFSATAAAAAAAASSLSLSVTASYPSSLSSVATLASCMANGLAFHLGNIIQDDDCDCDDDDDYDDNAGRDDNSYEDSDGRYGNTGRDYMDTGYNSPSSPDRPFRNDGLSDEASIRKNPLALAMMKRVTHKLNGREGKDPRTLSVSDQVEALIQAATDPENVASSFKGWAPFW